MIILVRLALLVLNSIWLETSISEILLVLVIVLEKKREFENEDEHEDEHDAKTCVSGQTLISNGMNTSTVPDQPRARLQHHQRDAHSFCFVCSGSNPMGLALRFHPQPDGSVRADFLGNNTLEGYPGLLHGGVIASLLDGVMTNCLFARGIRGLTAELKVRYHQPVAVTEEIQLRAWLEGESHGLYQPRAELVQGGEVKAGATAKFLNQHE